MSEVLSITPVSALLCDDIRQEQNGKLLLVGAYPEGISVATFPAVIPIGVLFQFRTEGKGKAKFELRLNAPGNGTKATIRVELDVQESSKYVQSFAVGGAQIPMTEPGEMTLEFRQNDDDEWKIVSAFPITSQATQVANATADVAINR